MVRKSVKNWPQTKRDLQAVPVRTSQRRMQASGAAEARRLRVEVLWTRARPFSNDGCANAESYPRYATPSSENGPFESDGDALRRNLSQLLHELFGEMDATQSIRPRSDHSAAVVQGFAPDDAVRFVSLLKDLLRKTGRNKTQKPLCSLDSRRIDNARIDRLADIAADKYAQCANN